MENVTKTFESFDGRKQTGENRREKTDGRKQTGTPVLSRCGRDVRFLACLVKKQIYHTTL